MLLPLPLPEQSDAQASARPERTRAQETKPRSNVMSMTTARSARGLAALAARACTSSVAFAATPRGWAPRAPLAHLHAVRPAASSLAASTRGFAAHATPSAAAPAVAAAAATVDVATAEEIEMKGVSLTGRPLYLDMQSTTPVDPRVLDAMLPFFVDHYGNPHSRTHLYGWEAENAIEIARKEVADSIGANPKEIIFTSGATAGKQHSFGHVVRRTSRRVKKKDTFYDSTITPFACESKSTQMPCAEGSPGTLHTNIRCVDKGCADSGSELYTLGFSFG